MPKKVELRLGRITLHMPNSFVEEVVLLDNNTIEKPDVESCLPPRETREKRQYMNKDEYPSVLNINDISDILRISKEDAYHLANLGEFKIKRVGHGRKIIVEKEAFINWLIC